MRNKNKSLKKDKTVIQSPYPIDLWELEGGYVCGSPSPLWVSSL